MDIELNRLGSGTLTCILYVYGKGDCAVLLHLHLVAAEIRDGKLGVTQAVTECKGRLDAFLIGPAVTYIDAFLIFLINDVALRAGSTFLTPGSRIGVECMSTCFLQRVDPCKRQLAARVCIACKDACKGFAALRTDEPALYDAGNLSLPRHSYRIARDVDINEVSVCLSQSLDQLILMVWQLIMLAVVTLAVLEIALVQTAKHDDIVGCLCFLYGFGYQFSLAALVFQVLAGCNSIVVARYIAHIAAGIIYLDAVLAQACLQAIERRNLALYLERRRASAYGHHLDGILAHYQYALSLLGVDREHIVPVLEQYDAFLSNLSGCCIMALGTEETMRAVRIHRGAIEEAQYAAHLIVQLLLGELAFLYGLHVRHGEIIVVVGIGSAHRKTVCPGAELHIQPVLYRLLQVVSTAPVAYHDTIILPVALQNLVQGPLVVAVVLILI